VADHVAGMTLGTTSRSSLGGAGRS